MTRCRSVRIGIGAALAAFGCAAVGWAREWTSTDGKKLEAEFVRFEGEQVVIKRASDGKLFQIPPSSVSAADQEYLRQKRAEGPRSEIKVRAITAGMATPTALDGKFLDRRQLPVGSTIFDAAAQCHLPAVDFFIQNGWSAKDTDANGYSVLSYAFSGIDYEGRRPYLISYLLQKGADPGSKFRDTREFVARREKELNSTTTFFPLANSFKSLEGAPLVFFAEGTALDLLIRAGADVNAEYADWRPLYTHVRMYTPKTLPDVKRLLDAKARPNDTAEGGLIAIQMVLDGPYHLPLRQLLLQYGSKDIVYKDGRQGK